MTLVLRHHGIEKDDGAYLPIPKLSLFVHGQYLVYLTRMIKHHYYAARRKSVQLGRRVYVYVFVDGSFVILRSFFVSMHGFTSTLTCICADSN